MKVAIPATAAANTFPGWGWGVPSSIQGRSSPATVHAVLRLGFGASLVNRTAVFTAGV